MNRTILYFALAAGLLSASPSFAGDAQYMRYPPGATEGIEAAQRYAAERRREQERDDAAFWATQAEDRRAAMDRADRNAAEMAADRRAQQDRDAADTRQGVADMEAASRAERDREIAEDGANRRADAARREAEFAATQQQIQLDAINHTLQFQRR